MTRDRKPKSLSFGATGADGRASADRLGLSESDQQELGMYFDGELSQRRAEDFETRLRVDSQLAAELELLKGARQEVRSWFKEETAVASGSVWNQIQAEVEAHAARGTLLERSLEFLRGMLVPKRLVAAAGFAVLALAVLNVGDGSQSLSKTESLAALDQAPITLASSSSEARVSEFDEPSQAIDIPFFLPGEDRGLIAPNVSRVSRSTSNTALSSGLSSGAASESISVEPRRKKRITSRVRIRIPASQIVGKRLVSGSLIADGVEIEWIETAKPYHLVRAKGGTEAPVIWVTSNR